MSSIYQSTDEMTQSSLSYETLTDVLSNTNISVDDEAVMVTKMKVDPRHVDEFERILRLILKSTHTAGHVSTCVIKPHPKDYTYTSIVKYSSIQAMRKIYPSSLETGEDFYKLFAARDSLLLEPPTYQIESGFGTWIESNGDTKPMREDDEDPNRVFHDMPGPCCDDSCDNPHGLNVRASFVAPTQSFQLFQPKYQRNNKKGGQKNLRCFPCCRNGRHVSSGFCGDAIRVHVAVTRITETGGVKICPLTASQPAVLAFGRFVNLEGPFDTSVSGPEVFPGQTIEKHEVLSYVRDKERPMNPLFQGILRGATMENALQSAIYEFNSECKAWHYGWTAPRGQGLSGSDAQHVFEVLFVKPLGAYMHCLERLRSDGFSIYSSRRACHATPSSLMMQPALQQEEPSSLASDDEEGRGTKRKRNSENPQRLADLTYGNEKKSLTQSTEKLTQNNTQSAAVESVQFKRETPTALGLVSAADMFMNPALMGSRSNANTGTESRSLQQQMDARLAEYTKFHQEHYMARQKQRERERVRQQQQQIAEANYLAHDIAQVNTGIIGAPPPAQMNTHHHQELQALQESHPNDLWAHNLFVQDIEPPKRVMGTDEIPWAELYNLFDSSQLPLFPLGDQDLNDPDRDESTKSSLASSSSTPILAVDSHLGSTVGPVPELL